MSSTNDYFDDMGWLGIATVRLADRTTRGEYLQQAADLWRHIRDRGSNDAAGGGIAWRKSQLRYKNTPSTDTFIILGTRLYRRTGEGEYLDAASRAFDWLDRTLRRADGFIEDGINRTGDGRIDTDWTFSYNQGLYVGACAELARAAGRPGLLTRAFETERAARAVLARDGVLVDEGGGGDEGLFKGVWYRYAAQLAACAGAAFNEDAERTVAHLVTGCEILWTRALRDDRPLADTDWRYPAPDRVPLSAQLAAVIATEACARAVR
jgi:predicted alpha-1,6-mannanase (GH76 family)